MEITVYNARELLIAIVSICGEMSQDAEISSITAGTMTNTVSALKKAKIFFVNRKERRVRFRWVEEGQEGIKEISPVLLTHYIFLTNNHIFKSGEMAAKRQRELSEDALFFLLFGSRVDNIKLNYCPIRFGKTPEKERISLDDGKFFPSGGEILNLKEFVSGLPDGESFFYSSKVFKRLISPAGTSRINTSKSTGLFLANGNVYSVYKESILKDRTSKTAEKAMRKFSFMVRAYAFGEKERPEMDRGAAIVFFSGNPKEYKREVKSVVRSSSFVLDRIYGSSFLIPENEDGKTVLSILEKPDWQFQLNRMLYKENAEPNGINDGRTEDGFRSWELLSCNYKKLKQIEQKVPPGEKIDVICFPWQEKIIKELTKDRPAQIRTARVRKE